MRWLMRALGVEPAADAAAAAARHGGAELRAAVEQREQQRQARIAELRRRFVEGPLLVMPGGNGMSDSRRETAIPDAGTVYFGTYTMTGLWGRLDADKGVLITTDNRFRRLPAPVPGDATTDSGERWTLKVAAGWVIGEGARPGDYELVRQQP